MLVLTVIGCVIFQTCIAIYLFNINKSGDGFEKNLTRIMIVLAVHLCTKFFLLIILNNEELYGQVAFGFGLAYGPLLYIVAQSVVKNSLHRNRSLLHLIPFFISSAIYILLITGGVLKVVSGGFIIAYTSFFQWFVVVSVLVYSILVKNALRIGYKNLLAFSKNAVNVKCKLVNNIATLLSAGVVIGILFESIPVHFPFRDFQLRILPYSLFVIIPILILRYKLGQKVYGMPAFKEDVTFKTPAILPMVEMAGSLEMASKPVASPPEISLPAIVKRYEKSSLDEAAMDDYEKLLNSYVEKSKVYLNAELSLEELAQQVKIPKHHLTQLLNDRLKKNFYSYINECRIQEALTRLANVKNEVNILSLAYDCGFNSKSSFNNYFKKVTGHTPSAYRKMVETSSTEKSKMSS